jgi:hypothetical protein
MVSTGPWKGGNKLAGWERCQKELRQGTLSGFSKGKAENQWRGGYGMGIDDYILFAFDGFGVNADR